jgi:hypothetical protein
MSISLAPNAVGAVAGAAATIATRAARVLTGREKSLLDFARVGQVAPMVIIDSDIRYNPLTKDILHVLSTLFTAYYMQALTYEDLIGDVTITKRLEKFNPGQAKPFFSSFSFESNSGYGLPGFGMEAAYDKSADSKSKGSDVMSKDNINEMYEDRSLAIGKQLSVKLSDDKGGQRSVPVTIRLVPMVMDSMPLLAAFSIGSRWNSQSERKHRVNMGELRYLADYWLKLDVIEEHRQALLKDKSGVYAALSGRRSSKMLAAIASGDEPLASAAAMAVISAKTTKELERRLGGKLSSEKIRNAMFAELGLMILVVFDPTYEQMTFYYRDTPDATHLTANEVKSNGKKQDVNVMELINTFMNKGAPTF